MTRLVAAVAALVGAATFFFLSIHGADWLLSATLAHPAPAWFLQLCNVFTVGFVIVAALILMRRPRRD